MYSLLIILIILVCVLLGAIVLVQNPKGGGLTSNFSSSSQLMGVQKTGDFLEKGTWVLAILLMVFSMAVNVAVKGSSATGADPNDVKRMDKVNHGSGTAAPATNKPSSIIPPAPTGSKAK